MCAQFWRQYVQGNLIKFVLVYHHYNVIEHSFLVRKLLEGSVSQRVTQSITIPEPRGHPSH